MIAVSNADDLAYRALVDLADALAGQDWRVIGGHMVGILLTALPIGHLRVRYTGDSDAGITTEFAASGVPLSVMSALRYVGESGNHWMREFGADTFLRIDLLVPSLTGRFDQVELGGRGYDAAPGLALAFAVHAIEADVGFTFSNGDRLERKIPLPTLESALILQSFAYRDRLLPKDVDDLYTVLEIAAHYDLAPLGGWRMREKSLSGARLDSARVLHDLASHHRSSRVVRESGVPAARLAALIAELITPPA